MNTESLDASAKHKDASVCHDARTDCISLESQIPRMGKRLLKYLANIRSRLLDLREVIDATLESRGVPNNIDAIQNALAALDGENGKLELPSPISRLDLLLIWGAPQAKWITSIVFKGLEIRFNPDEFKIPSKRFFDLYGVDCPDGFLKTFDLLAKIEKFLGKGLELRCISFKRYGLSSYLFEEGDPPENALILHKHGHHELNYVPYAAYGSDAVTYGLLYDYYKMDFLTTVYHGDGDVSPYSNPLMPFIGEFIPSFDDDERVDRYFKMNDTQLIDYLINFGDYDDEVNWFTELKKHTIAQFISAYFDENPTVKQTISVSDKSRYDMFIYRDNYPPQEELKQKFPSSYLFCKTFPATPIALDLFGGDDIPTVENFVDLVDWVVNGYYFQYSRLKDLLVNKKLPLPLASMFAELRGFVTSKKSLKKKDWAVLSPLLEAAIEDMYTFATEMVRNGAEGYGFVVAIYFWRYCEDGELSKMSSKLLDSLNDSFCPPFIKKTAALHSVVRHDRFIPT